MRYLSTSLVLLFSVFLLFWNASAFSAPASKLVPIAKVTTRRAPANTNTPAATTVNPTSAWLTRAPAQVALDIVGINSLGTALDIKYPIRTQWVWSKLKKSPFGGAIESLSLRVTIDFPKDYQVALGTLQKSKAEKDNPSSLVFDVGKFPEEVPVVIKPPSSQPQNYTLTVQPPPSFLKSFFVIHQNCANLNLQINTLISSKDLMGAWAYCRPTAKNKDITQVIVGTFAGQSILPSQNRIPIKMETDIRTYSSQFTFARNAIPFRFSIKDRENQFEVRPLEKPIAPSRLGLRFGTGFTYTSYQEPIRGTQISQLGVNFKVSGRYTLIPQQLLVDSSVFLAAAPMTFGGATPPAHFLGINGRLGTRLPMSWGKMDYYFFAGIYYLKMLVSESQYGLKQVTGGQFFLTVKPLQEKLPFYFYFKYAPLVGGGTLFNWGNRELAGGGGVKVGRLFQRPLNLTLDIAHMNFFSNDELNGFSMFTTSIGVDISF